MRAFPAFLYAAAAAKGEKPIKKLFLSPHEVPPGEWFSDRELTKSYEAPASAPVPATPEQHIRALQTALDAERAAHAQTTANFEKRLAALEKKLAKGGKGKGGDDEGDEG